MCIAYRFEFFVVEHGLVIVVVDGHVVDFRSAGCRLVFIVFGYWFARLCFRWRGSRG